MFCSEIHSWIGWDKHIRLSPDNLSGRLCFHLCGPDNGHASNQRTSASYIRNSLLWTDDSWGKAVNKSDTSKAMDRGRAVATISDLHLWIWSRTIRCLQAHSINIKETPYVPLRYRSYNAAPTRCQSLRKCALWHTSRPCVACMRAYLTYNQAIIMLYIYGVLLFSGTQ